MKISLKEKLLIGTPICLGLGSGKPFLHIIAQETVIEQSIPDLSVEYEVARYYKALAETTLEVEKIKNQLLNQDLLEGAAIIESQLQMLKDSHFTSLVEQRIIALKKNAEYCFKEIMEELEAKFSRLEDPAFRERAKDIQDVAKRILSFLLRSQKTSLANIPANSVILAEELTPSEIAEADAKLVSAFVCRLGTPNSHTAILAKAKGIPFVSGIAIDQIDLNDTSNVIVDGRLGHVILNPLEEMIAHSNRLSQELNSHRELLSSDMKYVSETYDGHRVVLSANIEMLDELEQLKTYGQCGVGLFRSEFMLLKAEKFPGEKEQFEYYLKAVRQLNDQSLVIRTFDLGGDKLFVRHLCNELNSSMGCRAIRFLLKEKEIFKTQLKAILKASYYGNVSVMFPMVSTLQELLQAKKIVEEVKEDLFNHKVPFNKEIKIGCMIEVPSAALIADLLADECDFLSIGTNDLVQYALAIDRENHLLTDLYSPAHPSVIRLIKMIMNMAKRKNTPVSICGEVASDPRFTALLMGLGVHEFSVSLRHLPIIKNTIRHTSYLQACRLAEKVLRMSSTDEILGLLAEEYRKNFPEDLLYNPLI